MAGVVAFLALQLSKVPMIRDFGVLLAIGIVVLVAVGIVLPTSILGIREWTKPTDVRGDSFVERIVVKLGGLPTKAGIGLVIASLFLFLGGILVEGRTKIESDPIKWIDQGSQVVADIDRLETETGFGTTLGVLVQANNVYDQDVIDLIDAFTIAAESRPEVVASSSLVNTMAKIITIPGATVIPPTEEDIVAAAAVMPPAIARSLVNDDATATQINLRLAPASLEQRAVLVDELEADLAGRIEALDLDADSVLLTDLPAGQDPVRATPAGLATVGIGLLENLSANRAALTYLSLTLAGDLARAPVPQPRPGIARAGARLPGGGRVVADRRAARHPAQSADHRVGAARHRELHRVLGADPRAVPGGTPVRPGVTSRE